MFEERNPVFDEENQKKLIEQIQTAPDTRIFGANRFNRRTLRNSQIFNVIFTIVSCSFLLFFYYPIISEILLFLIIITAIIVALILSYLKYPHDYTKIFVGEIGVAKECKWDEGAIPWEELEIIEIKHKREEIEYIIFRSGRITLAYRNTYFVARLTLEIISEYIGGIDNWIIIDDLKEEVAETTKSDTFYMNPDIDKSEGKKKLEEMILREWVGDQDYDAGETEKHVYAKSDDELYHLIVNDPQLVVIKDTGWFTRLLGNFRISILCMIIAVALTFLGMAGGPYSWLIWIIAIIFYVLVFHELFRSDERLYVSPMGIVRHYFGSPEALEWTHVEFIDFHADDDTPVPYEFFGNKKRIYCPRHYYHELLSMDHILQYLPELEQWKKVNQDIWEDGSFRLIRPET